MQDIVEFWYQEFGVTAESNAENADRSQRKKQAPSKGKNSSAGKRGQLTYTHRQGQFLAFIHSYRLLHRQAPSEFDFLQFFRVSPPSSHDMIIRLEKLGLIAREPGVPRSIRLTIPESEVPTLEPTTGPPV